MSIVFIVVDGLDGCGKDTHAAKIRELLVHKGRKVVIVSHPSGRFFGRMSKRFLVGTGPVSRLFASIFYTADVLASVRTLKKIGGSDVVFVRYLLGTAYLPSSLAPFGYRLFRNLLPFPDLALFIDIEPDVAIRRIAARGHPKEMFETADKLTAVRAVARKLTRDEWIVIDNSEDGDAPFVRLREVVSDRLGLASAGVP